jgi:hypothetical protein
MSDENTPDNVIDITSTPAEEQQAKSIVEIVNSMPLESLNQGDVIHDMMEALKQCSVRLIVGVGLLERIMLRDKAAEDAELALASKAAGGTTAPLESSDAAQSQQPASVATETPAVEQPANA